LNIKKQQSAAKIIYSYKKYIIYTEKTPNPKHKINLLDSLKKVK